MSEYQYYEFLAVDRPLTSAELVAVRRLSTRAQITPTRFVNEYQWGDFRGDPAQLMERHYDAHLYWANWGTRRIMLRLPAQHLPLETVRPYLGDDSLEAWTHGAHTLLHFFNDPEEADDWDESGDLPLSSIIGIRYELASGDLRPLYLTWLIGLTAWELHDADEEEYQAEREPPVPPGLGSLTGPQQALADFLGLDPDLLAVAAEGAPTGTADAEPDLATWISALPASEKDDLLLRSAQGTAPSLGPDLLARYRRAAASVTPAPAYGERRSAAQLLDAAHTRRTLSAKLRAQERAAAEQLRQEEAARRHETHLTALAADPETAWQDIDRLIAQKKASAYNTAAALLGDLRELSDRAGDRTGFDRRAAALRRAHQGKPALLRRLDSLGVPHTSPAT
ncbi:hypothetical protein ACFYQ5_09665 [Streptomyces sp. NPDC005794]|uniref:hypothetical protein n=1 Tax=Streptomyces sp. NPDC005794 TaxID=3364733 RepID=UPI0036AC6E7B